MRKKEIIIIAIIVAVCGIFLLYNYIQGSSSAGNQLTAVVSLDGEIYKSIPLSNKEESFTIETKYGKNILKVHDGGIEMIDADCPDKICKGFGFVNKTGDIIVCLPHHLMVEVTGTSD